LADAALGRDARKVASGQPGSCPNPVTLTTWRSSICPAVSSASASAAAVRGRLEMAGCVS